MAEEATLTDKTPVIPVVDASETEEALNAKIDEELGLKPQAIPEPPKEDDPNEPKIPEENPSPEPNADDSADGDDEQAGDDAAEEVDEPPEEKVVATPSDEDLFIEVVDSEGVTHKISTLDDLPDDFVPKNNVETLRIVAELSKLDAKREQRATDAVEAEQAAAVKETQDAQFKSWDKEIAELGKTDRVDIKDTDRINDVFGYMNEINAARQKAGNPNLITSYEDALEKYEAKEVRDKAETDKKNGNDLAKAKSSVIGRSSATAGADRYVYRAGSARSIDDIPVSV